MLKAVAGQQEKEDVLKSRVHLDNLNKLHEHLVLVYIYIIYIYIPADKASNNVIVVCKKYYIPRCSD